MWCACGTEAVLGMEVDESGCVYSVDLWIRSLSLYGETIVIVKAGGCGTCCVCMQASISLYLFESSLLTFICFSSVCVQGLLLKTLSLRKWFTGSMWRDQRTNHAFFACNLKNVV